MAPSLINAQKRELKARAQTLEAVVTVGRAGISAAFLHSLEVALAAHELVKVKFSGFKEDKKMLAPQIAEQTGSELIQRIGNVAIYFRRKPAC